MNERRNIILISVLLAYALAFVTTAASAQTPTSFTYQARLTDGGAYANANRLRDKEDKPEKERGYYLHPELFNQPEEKGGDWAFATVLTASPGGFTVVSTTAGEAEQIDVRSILIEKNEAFGNYSGIKTAFIAL